MVPNAGSVLLPMHIQVLLCGPVYGLACGILLPLIVLGLRKANLS